MNLRFVVFFALVGACVAIEKRSVGWFAPTTPSPLAKYPVWKVHKYTGIDLKPVSTLETGPGEYPAPEADEVPRTVQVPDFSAQPEFSEDLPEDFNFEQYGEFVPESQGQTGRFLSHSGYGSTLPEAEDKVGVAEVAGIAGAALKKKKHFLGLLALSELVEAGKFKLSSKGAIAFFKGLAAGAGIGSTAALALAPGKTTVYRGVPTAYPPRFFSQVPFIGGFGKGVVHLPEPSLPKFPALTLVPEAPKLPKLSLPGPYKVPYSTGSYVSIKVPKPVFHEFSPPATSYGVPEYHPSPVYYPPKEPEPVYGLPQTAPPVEFAPSAPYPPSSPPAPPVGQYPPVYAPSSQYAPPQHHYQYSGPTSYQTTFDTFHSASEPKPVVISPEQKNDKDSSKKEDGTNLEKETINLEKDSIH